MIGFRNRFVVMLEWARSYLTYEKQARLITDEVNDLMGEPVGDEQAERPESAA